MRILPLLAGSALLALIGCASDPPELTTIPSEHTAVVAISKPIAAKPLTRAQLAAQAKSRKAAEEQEKHEEAASAERGREADYAEKVSSKMNDIREALNLMTEQSSKVADNPYVMYDSEWKLKMALGITGLVAYADAVAAIDDVPARFKPVAKLMKRLARQSKALERHLTSGVDHMNARALRAAASDMAGIDSTLRAAAASVSD